MPFISGNVTAVYTPPYNNISSNGTSVILGDSETGWEYVESPLKEDIITASGGLAPVSGTAAGTIVTVRATMVEYDKLFPLPIANGSPFYAQSPGGQPYSNVGMNIVTSLCGLLVLTPVANTPLALLWAGKTISFWSVFNITDVQTLLSYKAAKGPLVFRAYPNPAKSNQTYLIA